MTGHKITIGEIIRMGVCSRYWGADLRPSEDLIYAALGNRSSVSPREVLDLDVPAEDKIWLLFRPGVVCDVSVLTNAVWETLRDGTAILPSTSVAWQGCPVVVREQMLATCYDGAWSDPSRRLQLIEGIGVWGGHITLVSLVLDGSLVFAWREFLLGPSSLSLLYGCLGHMRSVHGPAVDNWAIEALRKGGRLA